MKYLVPLLLVGCTGTGDDSATGPVDTATAGQVSLDGLCPLVERNGGFVLQVYESYSIADGAMSDGVIPITVLTESTTIDDCTLWVKPDPFCNPPCENGDACDLTDTCIPYPETQDLGVVTMTGLATEVAMEPVSPGYSYFHTSLPHPAALPGSLVTLFTGEGAYDPVKLHGFGVTDMFPGDEQWLLVDGQDLAVSWEAGPAGTRAEVTLSLNIDQHGVTPTTLRCTFADDGAGTVPTALITSLIGSGVTGFPSGTLARRTADKVAIGDACMDFEVSSPRGVDVRVDGHVPCTSDRDCPKGQSCNLPIQTCE